MENNNINKTKLRILLATDLHLHYENLNALGKYISENKENGDIANFDPMEEDQMEKVYVCEGEMSTALQMLENIHYNVIYVPGNHDAKTTLLNALDKRPRLTNFARNAHRHTIRIAEDLVLLGLGGSLPGYRGDKEVWVGYPFKSDSQLKSELDATWREASSSGSIKENDSVLLMTHVGPDSSTTTIDRLDTSVEPIHSGINPGPLKFSRFALITIEKKVNFGWRVTSTEFKTL
ncbi:hypothetical protein PPL_00034 [Heterostelium album PN500]|uniref:Calcineurin-like phosphoesterase domain-containing protein n=1 Tax=Heterostelium pallidum (strain ATCC 26659 / Pp 5 / PN500) TaxID=670386 RepID=D3BVN3_HETP5|nr:hypothetical protein PPL_00034 [Heterostelium album PN500]EFA74536.1 hypothetical protein PPL_00034 [Heterostelium album PN500]|eukprot:XP_020426670.1 hypothetical protein PPL_00034 [Heterostelium album PN500]